MAVEVADILDTVVHGDALSVLRQLPDNSIDALCCDPPCGIAFMGKDWDNFSGKKKTYDSEAARAEVNANKEKLKAEGRGTTPYGFSSSSGQSSKKERDAFIAFLSEIMAEALRVLKPGAHALIWSLPRTSHWTATALENAGFEIRDNLYHVYAADTEIQRFLASLTEEQQQIFWKILEGQGEQSFLLHCFGSGFPKSLNVSAAIDKHFKAEREVIGISPNSRFNNNKMYANGNGLRGHENYQGDVVTAPATPEAQQHNGKGSALKPACETWWLCRKPLSEKSIAENVLKWNTGAINIDKTRIAGNWQRSTPWIDDIRGNKYNAEGNNKLPAEPQQSHPQGRWPSHLLLSHSLFCQRVGTTKVKANNSFEGYAGAQVINTYHDRFPQRSEAHHKDANGLEEVEVWQCVPGCPVLEMDRQSGILKNGGKIYSNTKIRNKGFLHRSPTIEDNRFAKDQGTASRYFQQFPAEAPEPIGNAPFFYAAKASSKERSKGLEKLPYAPSGAYGNFKGDGRGRQTEHTPAKNNHPTVKPLSLCRHLLRTIVPENGIVLDCFAGSGSILVAAIAEGYHFVGIEQLDSPEEQYVTICKARIEKAFKDREERSS